MIRRLRMSDVPRQALPGRIRGEDLAVTRSKALGAPERLTPVRLAGWCLASPSPRYVAAQVRGATMDAVAVARPRASARSWEIAHYFAGDRGLVSARELLDACATHASDAGGERIFLRTLAGGPLEQMARRVGFVPEYVEEVYQLGGPLRAGPGGAQLRLRPLLPGDELGLFRLYNAAVPASVRSATGLTMEQWRASSEAAPGQARAYAWQLDDQIHGWLQLAQQGQALTVDALLHPDDARSASSLLGDAARLAWGHSQAVWPVPSYQPILALALKHAGWRLGLSYAVLVRPLAERVSDTSFAPARA